MAQTTTQMSEIDMFSTGEVAIIKSTVPANTVPASPSSPEKPSTENSIQEPDGAVFKVPVKRTLASAAKENVNGMTTDAATKRRRTVSSSGLSEKQDALLGVAHEQFFRPVSSWMRLSLAKQPQTRFRWTEDTLDEQLKLFKSLINLEYHVFPRSRDAVGARDASCKPLLRRLSSSSMDAAALMGFPASIKRVYAEHILNYRTENPLQTLVDTCPTFRPAHELGMQQRYMMNRVNKLRMLCEQHYHDKLDTLCPSDDTKLHDHVQLNLAETGREIYSQMKKYLDFLSLSKTPVKAAKDSSLDSLFGIKTELLNGGVRKADPKGVQPPESTSHGMISYPSIAVSRKEEGELTSGASEKDSDASDNEQGAGGGTYSPSADEIDEDTLRVDIQPKPNTDSSSAKKKKKKHKKSKSESKEKHKKKKKDKKREHSPEELPRAYAHNRNQDGGYHHSRSDGGGRLYRHQGFRPFFRGQNFNPYNNRGAGSGGFRNFRYNQNYRFQHRGNFRPYSRPYQSRMYSGRAPLPASQRRRDQTFVSESSSDEGRYTRSRSKSKSRSRSKAAHRSRSRDERSPAARRSSRSDDKPASTPAAPSGGQGEEDKPSESKGGASDVIDVTTVPEPDIGAGGDASTKPPPPQQEEERPMSLSPPQSETV